jgi:hypothetical protein
MENIDRRIYQNIMQNPPIINRDYLSSVLMLSDSENIHTVEVTEVMKTNTALAIKLRVAINRTAGMYTKKLFIKTARSADSKNAYSDMSVKEAHFYELVRGVHKMALPVPTCYDAFVSGVAGEFVIVLEDISDKYHSPSPTALADKEIWLSCAESLARFHAAFWNLNNTENYKFSIAAEQELRDNAREDRGHLERFLEHAGERFDNRTKLLFRRALEINNARTAEERERVLSRHNVTLTSDDAHIYNFMLPKKIGDMPILVDLQFWNRGLGTGDLAHLTRVNFPKMYRQTLHTELVERYHRTLIAHGINGYSWDKCLRDYRSSVAAMVMIPVWQFTHFDLKYEDWSDSIEALVENYISLDCDGLLSDER